MYLTSITKLKLSKEQFNVIDTMSYRAKALYNSSLYEINNHFSKNKEYLNYNKTDILMKKHQENTVYSSLPSSLSQQTIMKLHKNYKSFFSLISKKQNKEYDKNIDTPKYKRKDSRKELIYTKSKNSSSFIFKDSYVYITVSKDLHKNRLKLCKVPNYLKGLDFDTEIKYMEIIPKLGSYELHIKYETSKSQEKEVNKEVKNWYSIDLGLNNLCTITSNTHKPILISGRHIKSINQKYNKEISKLKSIVKKSQDKGTSKNIQKLYSTRGYKLNNEIHKITDFIVQSILNKNIDTVVIGYNKEWKQNISLGKRNNQNFVQIPFSKIIQQLEYKLRLNGIEIHLQEESYSSKCSYFDNEEVKRQQTYKGNRTKRGLFITSSGIKINADVNGSLNIMRKFSLKVANDVLREPVSTGLVMNPIKINLRTSMSSREVLALIHSL